MRMQVMLVSTGTFRSADSSLTECALAKGSGLHVEGIVRLYFGTARSNGLCGCPAYATLA
jgi:hypothetical protein